MPDALQFMSSGLPRTAVPSTIHCDHLIEARSRPGVLRTRAFARPTPCATTAAVVANLHRSWVVARAPRWRAGAPRAAARATAVCSRAWGVAPAARGRRVRRAQKSAHKVGDAKARVT
jgi:hypothetical protein